jgi:predicted MFS family arabinose efflux permease
MSHIDQPELGAWRTFALSSVSVLAWLSIAVLPYEVSVLPDLLHISVSQAGWAAALELLALAISAALVGRSISGMDKRRLILLGVVLAAAASVVSMLTHVLVLWLLARIVFGVGLGLVAAASNVLPAQFAKAERVYACMQVALSVIFGLMMLAMPTLFERFGNNAVFVVELVALVLIGPLAFSLPSGKAKAVTSREGVIAAPLSKSAHLALWALTVMFVAQSALWGFAERGATQLGMSAEHLGFVFTAAAGSALVGAMAAAFIGDRIGMKVPLYIGYAMMCVVAWAMYLSGSSPWFVAAILLLNLAQTFSLPYVQNVLVELDESGRAASLSGAAINFGSAAGPALGGLLLTSTSLAPLGFWGVVVFIFSLVCMLGSMQKLARPAQELGAGSWLRSGYRNTV